MDFFTAIATNNSSTHFLAAMNIDSVFMSDVMSSVCGFPGRLVPKLILLFSLGDLYPISISEGGSIEPPAKETTF